MVKSGLFDIPLRTGHLSERPLLVQERAFCIRDVPRGPVDKAGENKKARAVGAGSLFQRFRQLI